MGKKTRKTQAVGGIPFHDMDSEAISRLAKDYQVFIAAALECPDWETFMQRYVLPGNLPDSFLLMDMEEIEGAYHYSHGVHVGNKWKARKQELKKQQEGLRPKEDF